MIGDWYKSLKEYFDSKFWENFDRKVNLSEQRVNELTNVEWADDIWTSFIETISEVIDADEFSNVRYSSSYRSIRSIEGIKCQESKGKFSSCI